jgi:hypothetical protein
MSSALVIGAIRVEAAAAAAVVSIAGRKRTLFGQRVISVTGAVVPDTKEVSHAKRRRTSPLDFLAGAAAKAPAADMPPLPPLMMPLPPLPPLPSLPPRRPAAAAAAAVVVASSAVVNAVALQATLSAAPVATAALVLASELPVAAPATTIVDFRGIDKFKLFKELWNKAAKTNPFRGSEACYAPPEVPKLAYMTHYLDKVMYVDLSGHTADSKAYDAHAGLGTFQRVVAELRKTYPLPDHDGSLLDCDILDIVDESDAPRCRSAECKAKNEKDRRLNGDDIDASVQFGDLQACGRTGFWTGFKMRLTDLFEWLCKTHKLCVTENDVEFITAICKCCHGTGSNRVWKWTDLVSDFCAPSSEIKFWMRGSYAEYAKRSLQKR